MKKYYKSKAGFSLVEMVIVIAIIVILAGVVVINIGTYVSSQRSKSSELESTRQSVNVNLSQSEAHLSTLGFDRIATGSSTSIYSMRSGVM